jgi:8-oxo-dGTP diphosphatase
MDEQDPGGLQPKRSLPSQEMPRVTAIIKSRVAIERNGLLLCARHEKRDGRAFWCLPGGRAEPGETPADAARRELAEEAGIEVTLGGVVWVTAGPDRRDRDVVEFVFRGRIDAGEPALGAHAGDPGLVALAWLEARALPDDFLPAGFAAALASAGGVARLPAVTAEGVAASSSRNR